jgi:2-phospho-L-lactate transferase/gluconeogenesis factor (CofD/UPF0052 family)
MKTQSFGNIMITAMHKSAEIFLQLLEWSAMFWPLMGDVLPVTTQDIVCALN